MTDLRPSRLKGERVRVSGLLRRVLLAELRGAKHSLKSQFEAEASGGMANSSRLSFVRSRLPLSIHKSEQRERELGGTTDFVRTETQQREAILHAGAQLN